MKITNRHNLPKAMVRAAMKQVDRVQKADFSVTELINPPQIVQLSRRYFSRLEADVSGMIWAILGSSVHYILEKSSDVKGCLAEQTLFAVIDVDGEPVRISGTSDLIEPPDLFDYKVTSAWAIIKGVKDEWRRQLNLNYYLCVKNGFKIERAFIIPILRDWTFQQAIQNRDFPQIPVMKLPVELLDMRSLEIHIKARVKAHKQAEGLSDAHLPECTQEERYAKNNQWAVIRKGADKAIKLYDSFEEAKQRIHDLEMRRTTGRPWTIEFRPGENTRCLFYCPVKEFCFQWTKLEKSPKLISP